MSKTKHSQHRLDKMKKKQGVKKVKVSRPIISENMSYVLLAAGVVATMTNYRTLGYVGIGAGVFGLLQANKLI